MAAGLTVGWLAQAAAASAKPYPVTTKLDVAYGPLSEQVGDVYTPEGVTGPLPVVIMIHGGGWITGSRGTVGLLGKVLAGAGIVVFNIDYRLAKADQPATRWPAQLVDAQLAVRFVRAHAAELDADPTHIGAIGDSVGGQLAMLLGELRSIVPGDASTLYPDQRPDVSAVVDQFGPTDIPGMGAGAKQNITLLFGTPTPPKAATDKASPLSYVTANTAPTYIIHGHLDQVVPFQQSERLDQALQAHQVPHSFVTFEGGHGYEGISPQEVSTLQIAAFQWLSQHLR